MDASISLTVDGTWRSLTVDTRTTIDHDGFQCGYRTPGQICSAVGMLDEVKAGWPSVVTRRQSGPVEPTDEEIRERMSGNLRRCGARGNIVAAIRQVAQ